MSTNNLNDPAKNSEVQITPFLKTILQQIRGQDTYGFYRNWSDELILKPFVVTKQKRKEISVEGEVDPATLSRINAFFRAIAVCIEQETGLMSNVIVNLNHEGFGWALVFAGRLLLVVKTLRDAHRFGFESLEKLDAEGQAYIQKALELSQRFPEVGKL
ncbi:MAG TPA: NifX-associated nitrogen fixation protein [Nostocaceae cyanobacterium]|nr:NifX-associated nitrogen fixation protein [Nostocaceae cyanobacterium]